MNATLKILHLLPPACALLLALSASASASTTTLFGKIDKFPVAVELEQSGDKLSGWYFYLTQAKQIRLEGHIGADGNFQLNEMDGAARIALFEGKAVQGAWSGTWRKTGAPASLPFQLVENRDKADKLSGNYECTGKRRDAKYGFTYTWNIALSAAAGRVRKFSVTQSALGDDGNDQACSIGMSDLKQQSAAIGAVLKATGDPADNADTACTIRIVGDADTMLIKFGDPGDDCHRVGYTMFCSPRAGWGDMVLDRHSMKCKLLQ